MEPPTKRPRLSIAPDLSQGPYTYSFPASDPTADQTENNPENEHDQVDIHTARAQNDQRLKTLFESIFEKYSRDFTDIGDEIDLQTGEVVVDNGHLLGMKGEDDTGGIEDGQRGGHEHEHEQDGDDSGESETETSTEQGEGGGDYDHGIWSFTKSQTGLRDHGNGNAWGWQGHGDDMDDDHNENDYDYDDDDDDRSSVDSLLDTAMSVDDPTKKEPTVEASHPLRRINHANNDTRKSVDPVWRVPEITPRFSFSTPQPRPSNTKPTINYNPARSVSPPGARSLWAVPQPGRPRKTNTDVLKEKKAKKDVDLKLKTKTSPKKTAAPSMSKPKQFSSPAKKGDWSFAIHSQGSGSESDDPLQEDYQPSPRPKNALNIRGKSIGSVTPRRNQISMIDGHAAGSKSQTPKHPNDFPNNTPQQTTSTPSKTRRPMTPDDVRLIVTMRYVYKKQWKQILAYFPGRQVNHLTEWNKRHWTQRRANPPQLSRPWSPEERDKLSAFKDRTGLAWSDIQKKFPGRSYAEIEFDLLRLWVGEEIWNEGGEDQDGEAGRDRLDDSQQDSGTASAGASHREQVATAVSEEPSDRSGQVHLVDGEHDILRLIESSKTTANADDSIGPRAHDTSQPEPYQDKGPSKKRSHFQSSPRRTLSTLFE